MHILSLGLEECNFYKTINNRVNIQKGGIHILASSLDSLAFNDAKLTYHDDRKSADVYCVFLGNSLIS